jgi:hypothetical protein
MGYFDNFYNEPLTKYKKILKMKKYLYMCSSSYGLMIIQILYNLIIVS